MSYSVRLVQPNELNKLLELYKYLHPDDPDVSSNESLYSLWEDICHDPNLFYLVVEEQGQFISACTLSIIKNLTRNLRPYGLIENVVTHPSYRKKGLGTQVLQKAIQIAKEHRCYKVMLLTSSKQEKTLRFYERAGFLKGAKTGFIVNL